MKKYLEEARVIGNEAITEAIYKLTFESPQIARTALPGQFVNVSVETAFSAPSLRDCGNLRGDGRSDDYLPSCRNGNDGHDNLACRRHDIC